MAGTVASAQGGYLKNLGERTKNSIDNKVNNRVENKVDETVDKALDRIFNGKKKTETEAEQPATKKAGAAWTCEECGKTGNTGKFCADCGAKKPGSEAAKPEPKPAAAPVAPKKPASTAYAKSDFVPGDEIFFEDNFEHEKLGEFPLRWDLMDGYVEVGEVDGRKALCFTDDGRGVVQPLMKDQKHFLPYVFTIEYDIYTAVGEDVGEHSLDICFGNPDVDNWNGLIGWSIYWFRSGDNGSVLRWEFQKPNGGDNVVGEKTLHMDTPNNPQKEGWNHIAWSFNKRALKGYINGVRVVNIPNAKVPSHFWFDHSGDYKYSCISNVRIAKGAVPLYDRLLSDGKIVTYAITFELGKADLKPESMVEIARVAKLMQEYPNLEFEVQGHCDASGSDKVNDPLSQKRAEAIVAALVEQGIASARLTAVGKGSHNPIADNKTEEGRAKNRRVEFVKK